MINKKELTSKLKKHGEVVFDYNESTIRIWETDQGETNVRGEDYMNYMYNLYDAVEYQSSEDPEDFDGGLCTGYAINAIEMAMNSVQ